MSQEKNSAAQEFDTILLQLIAVAMDLASPIAFRICAVANHFGLGHTHVSLLNMGVGQKRAPKNSIGKRKNRLKPVVPKGVLFGPWPYVKIERRQSPKR